MGKSSYKLQFILLSHAAQPMPVQEWRNYVSRQSIIILKTHEKKKESLSQYYTDGGERRKEVPRRKKKKVSP